MSVHGNIKDLKCQKNSLEKNAKNFHEKIKAYIRDPCEKGFGQKSDLETQLKISSWKG